MPVNNQDNPIVERIRQGDVQAYAILVDRYKDKVFSLVLGIVRSRELAEEVAQDVFVKAFRSLNNFREEATFSTWLYRIAYNSSVSETRKRKINHVTLEEDYHQAYGVVQDDHEEKEERHRQLNDAISKLNPEEQLLLQMYYREEKSVEDVSLCLNNSISNVKVKLFRLRNKLKILMEELNKTALAL